MIANRTDLVLFLAVAFACSSANARAEPDRNAVAETILNVRLLYLGRDYEEPLPLSLVDKPVSDKGLRGAHIALQENNRTGLLIGQKFELTEVISPLKDDFVQVAKAYLAKGSKLVIADLEADDLLKLASLEQAKDAVILNIRSSDDRLRQTDCRANVFHIIPSWSMRADALAQYLIWKKWRRWLLVSGKTKPDIGFSNAVRRAAKRFGGKLVGERAYEFDAGSRRTDTGHQQIQKQMPLLTQGAPEHDVVVVSDHAETFGDYLMFRTATPRPVAGTHGLVSVAWHRSYEQYAAMQMQNRFEERIGRTMTERDYTGWLATRTFGEAVIRTGKASSADVRNYLLSDEFEVAAFKGVGLTFRHWNLQLRQPILLSGPRALVSMSPQDGFLHSRHPDDTLGVDEPETTCKFNQH